MAVDTSAIKNTSTIDDAISAARIELLKLNLSEEQIKSVEEELARIAKDYDTNPTKTTEEEIKIDLNFDDSLLMEEESSELPSEVVTYEQQKQNCIDSSGKWENSKCQCPEGFTTNDTGTCVDANSSDVAEYCPATGNGLSSITDKTKIGDFCSSSNIAEGEVVRRKDKTCTCRASACNACCYSQNGQCKKRGANDTNNCPRQVYKNVQNINNSNDALKFCESKATNNCKVSKAIINYKKVNMNYFSKKLKQLMISKSLNQKDLATMAHVTQATISKWVKGELSPKVKSVEPLAKALGITVGDLIGDFGNNIKLSDDDKRLLSLSPKQKKLLLSLLDTLIENGLPSKF